MHLTVQTERAAGVAARAGPRGRAGEPAPPSRAGAAPPRRRGRWEPRAGRPDLLQPGGQRGQAIPPPALPLLFLCGWLCDVFCPGRGPEGTWQEEVELGGTHLAANPFCGTGTGRCAQVPAVNCCACQTEGQLTVGTVHLLFPQTGSTWK